MYGYYIDVTINDQNSNNGVIIMHDIASSVSETKDDSIMGTYQLNEDLTPEAISVDCISRDRHNLIQYEKHIHSIKENRILWLPLTYKFLH
jgi:hypothetical protein